MFQIDEGILNKTCHQTTLFNSRNVDISLKEQIALYLVSKIQVTDLIDRFLFLSAYISDLL